MTIIARNVNGVVVITDNPWIILPGVTVEGVYAGESPLGNRATESTLVNYGRIIGFKYSAAVTFQPGEPAVSSSTKRVEKLSATPAWMFSAMTVL